jgi:hypothetical protein
MILHKIYPLGGATPLSDYAKLSTSVDNLSKSVEKQPNQVKKQADSKVSADYS